MGNGQWDFIPRTQGKTGARAARLRFPFPYSRFPIRRWFPMLLLAALVTGCSGLRLSYRQADIILAWRADTYFNLDRSQKREFNARIDRLLDWHRYEQLPEYATFATAAIVRMQHGLRHDDVVWFVDGLKARYRIIVDRGADDAADLLATLTPEQIVALQKQWAKVNRKFAAEHELDGSVEKQKRARLKRMMGQIEDWTGSLAGEQKRQIAALIDPTPLIEHLRHQDRIRRQQEFLVLLSLRSDMSEFRPRLHAWLRDWERGRAPDYERLTNEVYERRIDLYIAVDKLITPAQRQHALRRLQDYIDDFIALSKRSSAASDTGDAARMAAF